MRNEKARLIVKSEQALNWRWDSFMLKLYWLSSLVVRCAKFAGFTD